MGSLASIFNRKLSDEMIDGFFNVLSRYPEAEIARAAYDYMDTEKKMPVPADIKERIATKPQAEPDHVIENYHKCGVCGHYGMAIQEEPYPDMWRCRQCYTGLSTMELKAKFRTIFEVMGEKKLTHPIKGTVKERTEELPELSQEVIQARQMELLRQAEQMRTEDEIPF